MPMLQQHICSETKAKLKEIEVSEVVAKMRGYPFVSPIKESQEKKVTDKEQEKKHLYAKLLSILTDEARLKYEKALANILTKKRGS